MQCNLLHYIPWLIMLRCCYITYSKLSAVWRTRACVEYIIFTWKIGTAKVQCLQKQFNAKDCSDAMHFSLIIYCFSSIDNAYACSIWLVPQNPDSLCFPRWKCLNSFSYPFFSWFGYGDQLLYIIYKWLLRRYPFLDWIKLLCVQVLPYFPFW